MMNYLAKHIFLLGCHARVGFHRAIEYKFELITNFLSYVADAIVLILFWNLVFSNVESIGSWNFPMLVLMTGFVELSEALWQVCFYSIAFSEDIVNGSIDKYLTRPINPLYAMIFGHIEFFALMPLLLSLGLIFYVVANYLDVMLIKLLLALLITVIGVTIFIAIYCIIGTLAFWFGRTRKILSIYRSFMPAKQFPLDILGRLWRAFFVFVFPAMFTGAIPVLIMVAWDWRTILATFAIAMLILIFWICILALVWKKGVQRYESSGE